MSDQERLARMFAAVKCGQAWGRAVLHGIITRADNDAAMESIRQHHEHGDALPELSEEILVRLVKCGERATVKRYREAVANQLECHQQGTEA